MPTNAANSANRTRPWRERLFRRRPRSVGTRLIQCFALIVLTTIAADVGALWAFNRLVVATERVGDVDEAALAVFRVHFDVAKLREMATAASAHDARQFASEAASIRLQFLQHVRDAERMLAASSDMQRGAEFSSALEVLRVTLLSQLDASLDLAKAGEWSVVQLRLANQAPAIIRFSSELAERVDQQVLQRRTDVIQGTRGALQRFSMGALTAAVLILLTATALSWYVIRTVTIPLSELTRGAEALARGDFQHRVAVEGDDELAVLGRAFEDASRQLKKLYEDLRRSERSLRDVIDTVPAHVWSASAGGAVDFVNDRLRNFAGLSSDEILGWGWERALHPDDRARFLSEWRTAVNDGQSMESEARLRRADGSYPWFLVRNVPLRGEDGKVVRWYGSGIEIDDRKRAEQERERLRELETEITHINRVSMLGELAASIAHEIKQPIAATIMNANACLRWLKRDEPDLDEVRQAADRIVADGRRAGDVIERLQSLCKKAPPNREPVDVNDVVREMIMLLRGEANRHAVSIRTDLPAAPPNIKADRVQLQQVLMNLMLNAIEAMKESGGVLALKMQSEDARLLISVSDTGVGLLAEGADRMFDAFFTTKPQGSGMGLAISRSIVESHGGRLWATRNEGPGATFHFTLPSVSETRTESLAPRDPRI